MLKTLTTVAVIAAVVVPSVHGQTQVLVSQPGGAANGGGFGLASSTNSSVFPQRGGDNITIAMSGSVTHVTWWGQAIDSSTFNGDPNPTANIVSFEIAIYEDNLGSVGTLVGSATVLAGDVVTTADGTQGFDGSDFFKYESELGTPIPVTAGGHIISIAAVLSVPSDSTFFIWQYSTSGADDGVFIDAGGGLVFDPGSVGQGIGDVAVVLTSITAEPPVTAEWIEQHLRDMSVAVLALDLSKFDAPNSNAAKGRRKAMSNKLNAAANLTAEGDHAGAIDELLSILQKLDGDPNPPDWMFPGTCRDDLRDEIAEMIALLLLL